MTGAKEQQWYLRFHGEAVGPFPSFQIARYLLLQRLHHDNEISRDKLKWYSIREVPEVMPEKRLSAPGISEAEKQRLVATQQWVEGHPELFVAPGSAGGAEDELLFQDELYHPAHVAKPAPRKLFGYAVALLLALAAVTVPFLLPEGTAPDASQCDAPAAPGVNWNNCQLQGSRLSNADLQQARLRNANLRSSVLRAANLSGGDLAYVNLSQSNLRGANLAGAVLTGANLRDTDMNSANLQNADLSYADLTGASLANANLDGSRLGYAILGDNTLCMPESVGRCIPARR